MNDAATPSRERNRMATFLLAAVCFGPPLAIFVLVSIRLFDVTLVLIPIAAVAVAALFSWLAKRYTTPDPVMPELIDELFRFVQRRMAIRASLGLPPQTMPIEREPKASPGPRLLLPVLGTGALSTLGAIMIGFVIYWHTGERHGHMPIVVQTLLAVGGVVVLAWATLRAVAILDFTIRRNQERHADLLTMLISWPLGRTTVRDSHDTKAVPPSQH